MLHPAKNLTGGRRFEVLAARGTTPIRVMSSTHHRGVLISADALWDAGASACLSRMIPSRASTTTWAPDAIEARR